MIDLSDYRNLLGSLHLPLQGSNRGYDPVQLFIQFMYSVWCGANRYAHLDIQRFGTFFRRLFDWERMPEHKAFQRYFKKFDMQTTNLVFGAQYRCFFDNLHFYNFTKDIDSSALTRYGEQ